MAELSEDSVQVEKRSAKNAAAAMIDENTPLINFSLQQHSCSSSVFSFNSDDVSLTMTTRYKLVNYYRLMCNRQPRSKSVFLIFLIFFFEAIASYTALVVTQDIVPKKYSTLISTLLYSTAGRLFYPVAGVLADTYFGRYNVIHIGLWLLWGSFALLTFSLGLDSICTVAHNHGVLTNMVLPVVSILLFSSGSGCVEAVIIPFGVDQLPQGASSDQLSSYFYYYYMTINISSLVAILLLFCLFDTKAWFLSNNAIRASSQELERLNTHILNVTVCLLALLALTAALLVLYCLKDRFFRDKRRANPIKLIVRVLFFAATVKRHQPYYNRAFRYGEERKPRIELAKREYDGIFTSEEVEDVKTFCWILLLVVSFVPGYTFTYGGGIALLTSRLTESVETILPGNPYFASNIIWVINCSIIVIILPVINHLVLPFWPNIRIKFKLGVGILLNVISLAVGTFLLWREKVLSPQQQFCWLVLPAVLFSVAEALVFVSALEFIYAQSPDNMKGLLTGLFYFLYGLFSSVGSLFYYNYARSPTRAAWFLFVLFSASALSLVLYIATAMCYRNRRRPTRDGSESEVKRRTIYENIWS